VEKLIRFLKRFVGYSDVREAARGDLPECVEMAVGNVLEDDMRLSEDAEERLLDHFEGLMRNTQGALFVACLGRRVIGMACCAMTEPEVWDSRSVATVWFLYVRPEFRRHPSHALGLMRACVTAAIGWKAERVRIIVDAGNRRLVERYEAKMGFKREISYNICSLEMEDSKCRQ
jgi:ribosomal protein S18 acetylase RimI-like enzyme